jgi:hypothetical protein
MAIVKELKTSKLDSKSKLELIENLEDLIQRVKNDEIEMFAAATLDTDGEISAYHSRLRKTNLLEVLGMIEMLSDYLKGMAHED